MMLWVAVIAKDTPLRPIFFSYVIVISKYAFIQEVVYTIYLKVKGFISSALAHLDVLANLGTVILASLSFYSELLL